MRPRSHKILLKKFEDAIVAINRPESLEKMINVAVRIDDRQQDKFVDKKNMVQTHSKK